MRLQYRQTSLTFLSRDRYENDLDEVVILQNHERQEFQRITIPYHEKRQSIQKVPWRQAGITS